MKQFSCCFLHYRREPMFTSHGLCNISRQIFATDWQEKAHELVVSVVGSSKYFVASHSSILAPGSTYYSSTCYSSVYTPGPIIMSEMALQRTELESHETKCLPDPYRIIYFYRSYHVQFFCCLLCGTICIIHQKIIIVDNVVQAEMT